MKFYVEDLYTQPNIVKVGVRTGIPLRQEHACSTISDPTETVSPPSPHRAPRAPGSTGKPLF